MLLSNACPSRQALQCLLCWLFSHHHGIASQQAGETAKGKNLGECKFTFPSSEDKALTGSAGMKISTYSWLNLREIKVLRTGQF